MVTHVEVTLKIENRSSLEPLRIDEPRGGDDGLRELLTRPMPIKSPPPIYDNIESELLREQLVTSAESPAEAFVKRLLNPSPASEIEPPGEQLAASEATVAALRGSSPSSFARYAAKAVQQQHRRLDWWCGYSPYLGDGCGQVPVRSVGRCSDSCVEFFGHCYNPATTTCLRVPPRPRRPTRRATAPRRRRDLRDDGLYGRIPTEIGLLTALQTLRIPPASPDARRGARPPLGVAGTSARTTSTARSHPRSASSRR